MTTDDGIQATVDAIVATRTTLRQRASDTLQALEKSQADIDAAIELHGRDSDAVALLLHQHNVLHMQAMHASEHYCSFALRHADVQTDMWAAPAIPNTPSLDSTFDSEEQMQGTFLLWLAGILCFFLLFTLPLFL